MKNYQRPRLVQLLKTVALLLERSPLSGAEIMEGIGAVPEGTRVLTDSQKRAFERIKEDLVELGVRLETSTGSEFAESDGRDTSFQTTLYSIPKRRYLLRDLKFTDAEKGALHLLARVLAREEGFPLRANLGQAFQKLSAIAPSRGQEGSPPVDGPPLPTNPQHDPAILDRLMVAASSRFPVEFEYASFHSETTRPRRVDPYGFFSRERIWYVVGRERDLDEIRVFRVGRIVATQGVRILERRPFEVPGSFRLRDYSTLPAWNFQTEAEAREVTIEFDPEEFWKVRSFCEEQGSVSREQNGEVRWSVPARSFEPLIRWLLPLGAAAIPLDPPEFVRAYRETVREMLANHTAVRSQP